MVGQVKLSKAAYLYLIGLINAGLGFLLPIAIDFLPLAYKVAIFGFAMTVGNLTIAFLRSEAGLPADGSQGAATGPSTGSTA